MEAILPVSGIGRLMMINDQPHGSGNDCQLKGRLLRHFEDKLLHERGAFTSWMEAEPKERYVPNGWSGR